MNESKAWSTTDDDHEDEGTEESQGVEASENKS